MKLAASKVDFRTGCDVGAKVVLAVPDVVVTEEVVEGEGWVVVLAVELVGEGVGVTEHCSVSFTSRQSRIPVEFCEQ